MNDALTLTKVLKRFDGVRALDNLSLSIPKGKITGVIGPNGSGKSTLVNVLSGTFPMDSGMVAVGDVSLRRILPYDIASYGITRTFQDVRLWNQMTVLDNLLVVLTERNVVGALFERHTALHLARAEELLRTVDLSDKRHELAEKLSYGQRKLLEIARALAMGATLYLFDEPFAGLFPEMVRTVEKVLRGLREKGCTIVLIEHNMDLIRSLSDHVIVLDGGELLAEGKPTEVLARRNVIEAYLGE